MKKLLPLFLSGAMLLGAAGCSGGTAASPTKAPGTAGTTPPASAAFQSAVPAVSGDPSQVKIGVLIPGSPTDGGFCQQGADAAKALEAVGYEVALVEAADSETVKSEAETMASLGYQIVFGHGAQTVTPLSEVSPDYPDTWFVTLGGEFVSDNQFPICVCAEEGCYVLGIVAGMMSKTDTIGYTLGGDYPSYTKYTNAFELAAKSVNADLNVKAAVLSATNSTEGYETTMSQINAGADMIFSNSNEGQQGALKAVGESADAYAFGCLGNFNDQYPDKIIANMVCDYSVGYVQAAKAILDGTAKPEIMFLTIASGGVDVVWNEEMRAKLPAEVVKAADQAYQDIKDGKIHVPNEYELVASSSLS